MKTVNIKLENRKAIIINKETIYLTDDEVKFKIINDDITDKDKLYYSLEVGRSAKIENKEFVVKVSDLKDNLDITVKPDGMVFPDLFILDLKVRDIKIIGDLLDEKYPDVIQSIGQDLKTLKKVSLDLDKRIAKLENEGVIK